MSRVPEYYKQRLIDLGGYLPDGETPKLRLVFAPEVRRAHGKLKGQFKYVNPETLQPWDCWILESWYPPDMCGTRESWDCEFMGPYPADCPLECCHGGYYGIRTPITTNGEYMELTEDVLVSIERKQMIDIAWSMLSEKEMLAKLDSNKSAEQTIADKQSMDFYLDRLDGYLKNKEQMDNADNRVFSFAEKHGIVGKGLKFPIGRPNITI